MRKSALKYLMVAVVVVMSIVTSTVDAQQTGEQIIADHTVVERFDDIPQEYMEAVKEMWLVVAGESHSEAYRYGLQALESLYPAFAVSIRESGTPEGFTSEHLRASNGTWGDLEHESGWIYDYGREDWYTSAQAVNRTKAGISYCNANGLTMAAMGYGWCYDPDVYDPTDYLNATAEYIAHCQTNDYPTQVFYSTGPVDGDSYTNRGAGGAYGYNIFLRNVGIRNHVASDPTAILFDYADILSHDADGEQSTLSWDGHSYEVITPTNLGDGSIGHIGPEGALRLAKAMWWMLARMAGWDGVSVENPVTSINVSSEGGNLSIDTPNGNLQLYARVYPDDASIKGVTWSVDDPDMASVGTTGVLSTKKKNGTVRVFAKAKDGTGITGFLDITLSNQFFPSSSQDHEIESEISFHSRIMYVHSNNNLGTPCELKMYDISGRLLMQKLIDPVNFSYDLGHFYQGIYIIQLAWPGWSETHKISLR